MDRAERTQVGLVFLLVGTILGSIPLLLIGLTADVVALAGLILVASGRSAFGPAHRQSVADAILVFISVFVGGFVLGFIVGASLVSAVGPYGVDPFAVESAFRLLLAGSCFLAIASYLLPPLVTRNLLEPRFRLVPWMFYGIAVAIEIIAYLYANSLIWDDVRIAFSGGQVHSAAVEALVNHQLQIQFVRIFPASLIAIPYGMAWARIHRGLPAPSQVGASTGS